MAWAGWLGLTTGTSTRFDNPLVDSFSCYDTSYFYEHPSREFTANKTKQKSSRILRGL